MALGRSKLPGQSPGWTEGRSTVALPHRIRRAANVQVALGLWLALSGFLWRHGDVARLHGLVLGLLVVVTSVWHTRTGGRPLDLKAAGWLLFATPLIDYQCRATAWHNLALSFVMVLTALCRDATCRSEQPAARTAVGRG